MRPVRILPISLVALLLGCVGCGGSFPSASDLPAIEAEAAKADAVPTTGGSPERCAVRDAVRHVLDLDQKYARELGSLSWRPELRGYLFRDESYIGGSFPLGTARILREMQELETSYLAGMAGFRDVLAKNLARTGQSAERQAATVTELADAFEARRKPMVVVLEAHRAYAGATADLYALMGGQPESVQAKRTGLEFLDPALRKRYDAEVAAVNAALDTLESALRGLDADQGRLLSWIDCRKRIEP